MWSKIYIILFNHKFNIQYQEGITYFPQNGSHWEAISTNKNFWTEFGMAAEYWVLQLDCPRVDASCAQLWWQLAFHGTSSAFWNTDLWSGSTADR